MIACQWLKGHHTGTVFSRELETAWLPFSSWAVLHSDARQQPLASGPAQWLVVDWGVTGRFPAAVTGRKASSCQFGSYSKACVKCHGGCMLSTSRAISEFFGARNDF